MTVGKQLIEDIKELRKSIETISVYNISTYSMLELYYKLARKINELIKELERFEGDLTEEVILQNEKLIYLLGDGLTIEVAKKITELLKNGELKEIIQNKVFKDIINSISNLETNKFDKNELISMSNLGQDVKEAMTGGSVAIVGNNTVLSSNIKNKQVTHLKTNFLKIGANLLFLDTLVDGYLHTDGSLKTGNYKTTDYIPFSTNSKITLSRIDSPTQSNKMSKRAIRVACFYDNNYNLLNDYYYDNTTSIAETINYLGASNVSFIRVSILNGLATDISMLYLGDEKLEYEIPYYEIENLRLNNILAKDIQSVIEGANLTNKEILNFGDSIGAGDGNNGKGYCELLAEKYNMKCTDFARGGATITNSSNSILNQVKSAISENLNPSYILINGGTNDINNGEIKPIGEITNGFNSTKDNETFSGSLEEIYSLLKNTFPMAKLCFVRVHKMNTRDYDLQINYGNRAIDISKKWSVPTVDIFNDGNLNTFIEEHKKLFTNATVTHPNGDGTHPNELGYKYFYLPKLESKLNTI